MAEWVPNKRQLAILRFVAGGTRYGEEIVRHLAEVGRDDRDLLPPATSIYVLLGRLEKYGVLAGRMAARGRPSGGGVRKYYDITDYGRTFIPS